MVAKKCIFIELHRQVQFLLILHIKVPKICKIWKNVIIYICHLSSSGSRNFFKNQLLKNNIYSFYKDKKDLSISTEKKSKSKKLSFGLLWWNKACSLKRYFCSSEEHIESHWGHTARFMTWLSQIQGLGFWSTRKE